jgi:hypothetical protein
VHTDVIVFRQFRARVMLLSLATRDVQNTQYSLLKHSLRHPNYVTLETEIVFKVKIQNDMTESPEMHILPV